MALLALKHTYRQAGCPTPDGELPDFLPLMLEFAALAPEPGQRLLSQCQAGLELLADALHETGSPYAALLDIIRAQLPELIPRQRAALHTLATGGPPVEQVAWNRSHHPNTSREGRRRARGICGGG